MQYPKISLDCVINLDENTTEFKTSELHPKLAKSHTSTDKAFIHNLVKELKQISTHLSPEEMLCWDSTDQENMPGIDSLNHSDLRAKNAFSSYFKQLLCRMSYAEL